MSAELLALALDIGVPLALRLIDYLLPKGRHFTIADRWSRDDDQEEPSNDQT